MRLRWTEPAVQDLQNICDYIDEHDGPVAARRVALSKDLRGSGLASGVPSPGTPGPEARHARIGFLGPSMAGDLSHPRGRYRSESHPPRRPALLTISLKVIGDSGWKPITISYGSRADDAKADGRGEDGGIWQRAAVRCPTSALSDPKLEQRSEPEPSGG